MLGGYIGYCKAYIDGYGNSVIPVAHLLDTFRINQINRIINMQFIQL